MRMVFFLTFYMLESQPAKNSNRCHSWLKSCTINFLKLFYQLPQNKVERPYTPALTVHISVGFCRHAYAFEKIRGFHQFMSSSCNHCDLCLCNLGSCNLVSLNDDLSYSNIPVAELLIYDI
ncbi:uncharacterized protein BO97DRAFT_198379 [Aspergillus homomorphus CBS 101889]|uniref:Uncharacterized protein n=1 Tax=Aspergillus homomorphus (strain CBS 101889) TaxID=1450537 RepID=A0A395HN45_ASPHC|nr:hypothetical protein BO97DRAFT_198379 [Aspergillus homomorphus CBS 101889]RAL08695.1 hypothetical protein BO97DRAFT_198379 [Aspergillus homomorphus CBS 101889]